MVGMIRRNALQQHEICLLQRPTIQSGNLVPNVFDIVRFELAFTHLDFEQMSVRQSPAKFGKDAVFIVAPGFYCRHYIVVI